MTQVLVVFQGTGVPQGPLALDLKDLPERRESKASQADLVVLVHLVLKVNQA